jgi:hypothetical protein
MDQINTPVLEELLGDNYTNIMEMKSITHPTATDSRTEDIVHDVRDDQHILRDVTSHGVNKRAADASNAVDAFGERAQDGSLKKPRW